jgi:hypothetical protein
MPENRALVKQRARVLPEIGRGAMDAREMNSANLIIGAAKN